MPTLLNRFALLLCAQKVSSPERPGRTKGNIRLAFEYHGQFFWGRNGLAQGRLEIKAELSTPTFSSSGMQTASHTASVGTAGALTAVRLQLLSSPKAKQRARCLLAQYNYLGNVRAVGEQLMYAVTDRQGGGNSLLIAITVPSQHYLGSAAVATKTNQIPVARDLFQKLDLDGCRGSLDALHTQAQTARQPVLDQGADLPAAGRLPAHRQGQPTHTAEEHPAHRSRPTGGFFPMTNRRPHWLSVTSLTKASPNCASCAAWRPQPNSSASPRSSKSRCCAATCAPTPRKRWP